MVYWSQIFCQTTYFKHQIFLDVSSGYLLYASNKLDSSVLTNFGTENKLSLKIFDNNNRGTLKFILSDTPRKIFIQGQYYETQIIKSDLSKIKRDGKRVTTSKDQPTTAKYYYRPIRSGQWYYYNCAGEIIKNEKYKKGKLLN